MLIVFIRSRWLRRVDGIPNSAVFGCTHELPARAGADEHHRPQAHEIDEQSTNAFHEIVIQRCFHSIFSS